LSFLFFLEKRRARISEKRRRKGEAGKERGERQMKIVSRKGKNRGWIG
jgi:hypothetical protein